MPLADSRSLACEGIYEVQEESEAATLARTHLRVSQNQRVEDILIDRQTLAPHELQNTCGSLDVALLAIACDQALICDPIGLNTLGLDFGQKIGGRKLMFILQIDTQQCIIV